MKKETQKNLYNFMKINFKVILQVLMVVLILLLVFRNPPQAIYPITEKKVVNNIKGKENTVRERETVIKYNEEDVERLNESVYNLQLELAKFKRGKDTVNIIHTQDNLIDTLFYQGQKKDSIIGDLKLNVADLKYINTSKDTLLVLSKADLKKVKRQRNILALTVLGITTIAIIK